MVTQILELLMDRRSKMCENETQMSDSHEFILILNFMAFFRSLLTYLVGKLCFTYLGQS